jgi:hypothetical protein
MEKLCKGKYCILQNGEGITKKIDQFNFSKRMKDGRESMCKECKRYTRSKEYIEKQKKIKEGEQKEENKKRCKKCEIFLEFECFSKQSSMKDGLASNCRKCKSGKENPTRIGKLSKAIHTIQNSKEGKICHTCKHWKSFCEDKYKKIGKYKDGSNSYESSCRKCFNKTEQERYHINKTLMTPEELKLSKENKSKTFRTEIKTINGKQFKFCIHHCEWELLSNFKINGSKKYITGEQKYFGYCNNCRNEKRRLRTLIDEEFRLLNNCRCRVYHALNSNTKSDNTKKLLGCSVVFLWKHLEKQFEPGMTRENYGSVWELDHIKPCSIFDFSIPREQRRCFNWKNLQPLFSIENWRKSNFYKFDVVHEIKLHFIT